MQTEVNPMRWLLLTSALFLNGCHAIAVPPTSPTVVPSTTAPTTPPPPVAVPVPLTIRLSASPAELIAGDGVSVRAESITGLPTAPTTYLWTFGDGRSITTAGASVSHVYANPGAYGASVVVTDGAGRQVEASQMFTVSAQPRDPPPDVNPPPKPSTGLTASMSCTAAKVNLDSSCNVRVYYKDKAQPASTITSVEWSWGDSTGTEDGDPAMNHTYTVAGSYHVWADVRATTPAGSKATTANAWLVVLP